MKRLPIRTAQSGFFKGLCKAVVFASLLITSIFLVWVIAADNSGALLRSVQTRANILFGGWYIYVSTFYLLNDLFVKICVKRIQDNFAHIMDDAGREGLFPRRGSLDGF